MAIQDRGENAQRVSQTVGPSDMGWMHGAASSLAAALLSFTSCGGVLQAGTLSIEG